MKRLKKIPTVAEIRADKIIGRGTCSTYDECYTDEELMEDMKDIATWCKGSVLLEMRKIDRICMSRLNEMESY